MSKAARTEKAVAAKKATAELAQQAIVKAKAKMVNNEIQRNLGLVEHMCNSYKASEITDKELAHAVMNIVADHDLLTPKTAEAFIVDYCERNELDVPTAA
jgi:iron only hydrogenase large subunit-like protein